MSRSNFSKKRKPNSSGFASNSLNLSYGSFGLKSLNGAWLTANQLEALRKVVMRYIKSANGYLIMRAFATEPITKKPAETRMGGGKGGIDYRVHNIKKGAIICEIGGVSEDLARDALLKASYKLPVDCKFITRMFMYNNN